MTIYLKSQSIMLNNPTTMEAYHLATVAIFAEFCHLVFVQVELWPNQLLLLLAALFSADAVLLHYRYLQKGATKALRDAGVDAVLWTLIVFCSMGVYRLFLHRLARFPGPTSWAVSKWAFLATDIKGTRPFVVDGAHRKYGDVVRTGPRELSINAPGAISAVLGAKSATIKGPWYFAAASGRKPGPISLHATRDPAEHARRRKLWDEAFNANSLREYEAILIRNVNAMVSHLEQRAENHETLYLDDWCMLYGFDVMSEIGFGTNFGLMDHGKLNHTIETLEGFMTYTHVVGNLPYLTDILSKLPNPALTFGKYVANAMEDRRSRSVDHRDIMYYLLDEDDRLECTKKSTDEQLLADARLIIVAGSDTSSTVMGISFFLLLKHPESMTKLREEVKQVFGDGSITDFGLMDKQCPYLNAVINESMRLYPPVASGLQRVNESGPMVLNVHGNKVVVPQNSIVTVPTWTLHRDARNFSPGPNDFRPERWIDPRNETAFDKTAFNPFSFGRTSCVGKALAYMEIRLVIARLVQKFDIRTHATFDAHAFERGIRDAFVTRRLTKVPVTLHV